MAAGSTPTSPTVCARPWPRSSPPSTCYNLRGNQRTAGEQSRKEGGKIFGGGSRATVAITLLVKNPDKSGPATIHYTDIGDYLTAEQKLAKVAAAADLTGLDSVAHITPNEHGDWLNQRRDDFDAFMPLEGRASLRHLRARAPVA